MRFAHLSDSHLGYRQYGIDEREQDFYDVFEKALETDIDDIHIATGRNITELYEVKDLFDLIDEIIPIKILNKLGLHYVDGENVNLNPSLLGDKNIENIKKYLDKNEIKKAHINL